MKYALGVLVGLLVLLAFAWQAEKAAHHQTRANASAREAALHQQAAHALAVQMQAEQELSDAAIKNASRVDGLLAQIRRGAVRGSADSERLRGEAAQFAARGDAGCQAPPVATDIEADPSAAVVLADLLGRADVRANLLAQALDESRARGLACEADYDRAKKLRD